MAVILKGTEKQALSPDSDISVETESPPFRGSSTDRH